MRAGRFVGVHTSSRSFVSRSNRLALATRKSDTVFRMELACLCPCLGIAELISSRRGTGVESRSRRYVRDLIRQRKARERGASVSQGRSELTAGTRQKAKREADEKAKRSGDGVRAAASEDAGTSPASSQVLFSTVPIVTRCELIVHACTR